MKRILLIVLFCLICLFTAVGCTSAPPASEADAPAVTASPEAVPEDAPETAPSQEETSTVRGYVLVSSAAQTGWLPLPAEGESVYPLLQQFTDGSQTMNLIRLTPDGMYMEDADCENHDCIDQGTVTLENRYERILGNMIICLPNQVLLQLYSAEEVREMAEKGMPTP